MSAESDRDSYRAGAGGISILRSARWFSGSGVPSNAVSEGLGVELVARRLGNSEINGCIERERGYGFHYRNLPRCEWTAGSSLNADTIC